MLLNCFRTILQHQAELFLLGSYLSLQHMCLHFHHITNARETSGLVYYLHIGFASTVCIFSPLPLLSCALPLLSSLLSVTSALSSQNAI